MLDRSASVDDPDRTPRSNGQARPLQHPLSIGSR
jgi:hypothetical protein